MSAFSADLYEAHRRQLTRLAALLTGSPHLAEDAVQDVFVRLQSHRGDIRDPVAFARTAVVNRCRDLARRERVQRSYIESVAAVTVVAPAYGSEEMIINHTWLVRSLMALSPRQRYAIVLRHVLDLDDTEIALMLHCRPSTVRSLISRGLKQLGSMKDV